MAPSSPPAAAGERPEIAFFDVETTVPTRPGQCHVILEFGAILVCPRTLEELHSYSTLLQPDDLSLISSLSVRCNGISRDAVVSAPFFADVADQVYDILHGRVWAGHNIIRFDCARIREAFGKIGRPPPEPKGIIDSLALLTQKFGRRAGNMKMATLATYFGIGQQTHRSLDDVRMNLEVLKHCSTVLFLESSLPDILTADSSFSPKYMTRSSSNGKPSKEGFRSEVDNLSRSSKSDSSPSSSSITQETGEHHPILSLRTSYSGGEDISNLGEAEFGPAQRDPFNMGTLSAEIDNEAVVSDVKMEEPLTESLHISPVEVFTEGCSGLAGFLEPERVSLASIRASLIPFYRGTQKLKLLHNDVSLQLFCSHLKVRFGISSKYTDRAGRPRLSFLVDILSSSLCEFLVACDDIARKSSAESGSSSEWKEVVNRNKGFVNKPTVRLHIPMFVNENVPQYGTEIYQQDSSGTAEKLLFSESDAEVFTKLLTPGTTLDAFVLLDTYDYQQKAGIKMMAKRLVIYSN